MIYVQSYDRQEAAVFRIRISIKICLLDPDLHGQMRIRIQEVNKPRKNTGSLGEYRIGNIKVRILLQYFVFANF